MNILLNIKTVIFYFKLDTIDISLLTKKLYITYNNMRDMKKVVVNKYKDTTHLCECIIRSSFVPYLINGELLYKNKYIDGFIPYLFSAKKNRKILYLNIVNFEKIGEMMNVKNETTNYGRILSGLLDVHMFYIKNSSTQICSYVKDWTFICNANYFIKVCLAKCIIYIICIIRLFHYLFPCKLLLRLVKIIIQELLHTVLI